VSSLDLRSFNLMSGLMAVVLGIVLLGVRRQLPASIQGLLYWGLAPLVCAGATLVYGLEGFAPTFVVSPLGNGLLLTGCCLYYFGSQRFYDRPVSWRLWGAVAVACLVAMQFFLVVVPDYRIRQACFAATMAAVIITHVVLLLRQGQGFAPRFTASVLTLQALVLVARGLATFWIDAADTNRFTVVSPLHTVYIAAYGFVAVLIAVGMQFMAGERIHREFEYIASHDSLTGTLTRRALLQAAEHEMQRWQRYGQGFSLLLLDIDHFKRINDQHGHLTGDRVLVAFAGVVQHLLRSSDRLGRYGGEEFMVLLPATDAATALAVAERMRAAVAEHPGPPGCTTSIGVTCVQARDSNFEALIARADAALYQAKGEGRNRVVAA
jgi:diguanylate cyclase (GGDEF)-like protein